MLKEIQRDKILWLLIVIVLFMFVLSLLLGSANISLLDVFTSSQNDNAHKIVLEYRLPRTLTAMLVGVALPISGWVLQEYFKNPLAGPSVLGVTSTAGLGVAIMVMLGSVLGITELIYSTWGITISGLIGAFVAMLILLWATKFNLSSTTLVIIGFMLASFSGSIIGILSFYSNINDLKMYILWSFGSLGGLSIEKIIYFFVFVVIGLVLIIKNIPSFIKLQLGEMYAISMGVNMKKLRLELILATSILTGICTALVGPIAFIGLAVPYICKSYLRTTNFYRLLAHIIAVGVLSMLLFTMVSVLFPSGVLPINIVTSLLGAPVVLHIIISNKKMWNG